MEKAQGWDGTDRRGEQEVTKYKVERVILDMHDIKTDVETIKKDMVDIKILTTEMRGELKQIVGRGSFITSSVVSFVITTLGGVIIYYFTEK